MSIKVRSRLPKFTPMSTSEMSDFVLSHTWKYAQTMPLHPHDYLLRTKCRSEQEFERVIRTIQETGFTERYGEKDYTVLDVDMGGGLIFKLWTMGAPVSETVLINRTVRSVEIPEALRQLARNQLRLAQILNDMVA